MNIHIRILRNSKLFRVLSPVGNRTTVNLSFKIFGSKDEIDPEEPPVLILHGLLGMKKNWKGVGKTILGLTKRSIVTVDLRNHGFSPQTSSHRYEEQAQDVLQLIKKLNVDKVSLIGHNMGARTAMCTSLLKPSAVAGLIAVEMSPVSTSPDFSVFFPNLMQTMAEVKWEEKRKIDKVRKFVKKQLKPMIKDDDVIMKYVLSNINVKSDGTIGWICNLDILRKHFKHISSFPKSLEDEKYDGPTMFIGGQLSEYIPADDLSGIREMFPRAVVKYIPGAGHHVHADDPKAFMELVIGFLKTY